MGPVLKVPPPYEFDPPEYSGLSAKIELSRGETAEERTAPTGAEVLRLGREATSCSAATVGDVVGLASIGRHVLFSALKIMDVPAPNFSGTD